MNKENEQKEKIRKVYLDDLPRWRNKKDRIDWNLSIGHKVKGVYEGIDFEVEIVKIDENDKDYIYIKYLDKPLFRICTYSFKRCMIGRLLGKRTNEFKVEIRQTFKNKNRDLTIIDKKYENRYNSFENFQNCKYYKYHCNKCGNEDWILESQLLNDNTGCNACGNSKKRPVLGINTIWDTDRWMCDLGVSEEDAKTHTFHSDDKITVTCPHCGRTKDNKMLIGNIYKRRSIGCTCGDGYSYPNKLMYSILEQLNISFTTEYSPDWIKPKRYDFYIPSLKLIIEMDGGLGHGKRIHSKKQTTKEESKNIDIYKDEVAKRHKINVIRIDCNYASNNSFQYIKESILESNLKNILDLNKINWYRCEEFALSNFVKKVCDYKKDNPDVTTTDISKIMGICRLTVNRYLKRGNTLNWCSYNPKECNKLKVKKAIAKTSKKIEVFKNGISQGIFVSMSELERISKEVFGVKLLDSYIRMVCKGEREEYKGFTFRYADTTNNKGIPLSD